MNESEGKSEGVREREREREIEEGWYLTSSNFMQDLIAGPYPDFELGGGGKGVLFMVRWTS